MKDSLVSIITPSYNSKGLIAKTIESVLAQTYDNWEMIIVDDASTDGSPAYISSLIKDNPKFKLIALEQNVGAAEARNRAIEVSNGQYIAFLDADDLWYPNKLEVQIAFMQNKNLAFSYSSYDLMDESEDDLGTFVTKEHITYESMLKTCSVGCLTAVYDAQKLGKQYMPLIRKRQDYGLWLKILKETDAVAGLLEPLARYRIMENSISSNKFKAAQYQWRIYREVEGLNMIQSLYYFIHYAINGVLKYR
jgi:teichuronic acid biosynthesis glycosyltransferase TuaG